MGVVGMGTVQYGHVWDQTEQFSHEQFYFSPRLDDLIVFY